MKRTFGFRILLSIAGILSVAASVGCNEGAPPTGSVKGTVKYGTKPVAGATILLECPELGAIGVGELDANGQYHVGGLRLGEYVVAIVPPAPEAPNENSSFDGTRPLDVPKAAAPKDIPAKFASSQSSPLRHIIVEGESEFTVDLAK